MDLDEDGPYNKTFISDGRYSRWQLTVSVTASEQDEDLEFLLDGKPLPWKSTGLEDREFYNWDGKEGFSFGFHNFAIRSKSPSRNEKVPRMICSIALHEFGTEEEFHMENDYVSAYPTWNFLRKKSYRPTNAGCIMRNMTQERFCPVCQEGMWIQFLSTVSLIDDLSISNESRSDGTRGVTLKTLQFGQFRPEYQRMTGGEFMQIRWIQNNREVEELKDQTDVFLTPGDWTVTVKFVNPEVKYDPYGVLHASKRFEIA
ncbi:hypothetical protein Ocin01_10777 [Orchesella cincta]|uniref:Uncharacterized protein n=1 Tax=Orchesella cincta TaxID=48709 RepID=A0A1D2MSL8_ORCCI|nr:hypothetical protein Ocin01_10777 [Orchesella cincta]